MWMHFLVIEEERCTKQDYYLAQIAATMERTVAKDAVPTSKYLLKFKERERTRRLKKEISVEEMTKNHKQFWFRALGMDKNGNIT